MKEISVTVHERLDFVKVGRFCCCKVFISCWGARRNMGTACVLDKLVGWGNKWP